MAALRIGFIGDSITLGTGDADMLGWPGRVCARAWAEAHDVTLYNLGIRGETSEDIRQRWRGEAVRRLPPEFHCALAFAFGIDDCVLENGSRPRVSLERTVANTREILSEAKAWLPSIFVGPARVDDSRLPPQLNPSKEVRVLNSQIHKSSLALSEVAAEVGVPCLGLYPLLAESPQWQSIMKQGDSVHPRGAGYELIADLVQQWPAWKDLFLTAAAAKRKE
jgi:acyl-CoA thioesterase-1